MRLRKENAECEEYHQKRMTLLVAISHLPLSLLAEPEYRVHLGYVHVTYP